MKQFMAEDTKAIIVFTTAPNTDEAESLAQKIVEARLAACVQILPPMTSIYFWEGKIQKDSEHLLLIKTLSLRYDKLEQLISENHSYDTPEIIAVESEKVSQSYLDWMKEII